VVGVVTPRNRSDEDAVFQNVEPSASNSARGLKLRFAAVPGTGRCNVGAVYGWPPDRCREPLQAIKGFRVSPGKESFILVGASASHPGRWFVPGFKLRYKVGWRTYATVLKQGLILRVSGSG